jgi:hypothetical protein
MLLAKKCKQLEMYERCNDKKNLSTADLTFCNGDHGKKFATHNCDQDRFGQPNRSEENAAMFLMPKSEGKAVFTTLSRVRLYEEP